jgi:acylphosphatase
MEKLLFRIHITGHVQGVGFRWNAAREARLRGITGFVRNMPDGSVYIEAEGYKEQLDEFVKWCRQGPGMSEIDMLTTECLPPVNYTEFSIQH